MTVLDRLNDVFQEVFEDDELVIERNLTANDVDDWDSLTHVNLVLAAEREFDIRLSSSEVTSLKDVGQFVDLIEEKM